MLGMAALFGFPKAQEDAQRDQLPLPEVPSRGHEGLARSQPWRDQPSSARGLRLEQAAQLPGEPSLVARVSEERHPYLRCGYEPHRCVGNKGLLAT
jgi:hypothetical protein